MMRIRSALVSVLCLAAIAAGIGVPATAMHVAAWWPMVPIALVAYHLGYFIGRWQTSINAARLPIPWTRWQLRTPVELS